MASDVLAVAFAIALLVSNVCASKTIENVYAHSDNYGNSNDTTSFTWQDLRNEINQGDALTYELGAPQYQILNADEPIEIITPDQPGYYESLKRYEQAAEQTASKIPKEIPADELALGIDSTTVAPEETKEEHVKDKHEKQTLLGNKKIRFIILNSKKKSKSSKIYLGVPKNKQQGTFVAESLDMNEMTVKKSKSAETSTVTQQTDSKKELPLQNSFKAINQKQSSSAQTNTTEETPKQDETTPISIVELMTNPPISYKDQMVMESPAYPVAMPTANVPIEMSLPTAPILQQFLRPDDDISSTFPGDASAEPHAAGSSSLPLQRTLPHMRDFEYMYRSALGLR